MKIFSRLVDDADIHLRTVNNLERGGEEIVSDKPAFIFVQAHLSGLSADILIKHLKKQLGKKRSHFVLLATPEQATEEAIARYHGYIYTTLDDISLSVAIRNLITGTGTKTPSALPSGETTLTSSQPQQNNPDEASPNSSPFQQNKDALDSESANPIHHNAAAEIPVSDANSVDEASSRQFPVTLQQHETPVPFTMNALAESKGDSLEDQGVTYSPKPRISVQSQFTSSFDSAVKETEPPEPVSKSQTLQSRKWDYDEMEAFDPPPVRSKTVIFFLWLVPVLAIVVIVTIFQQRKSTPKPSVAVTQAKPDPVKSVGNQAPTTTTVNNNKAATQPALPSASAPTPEKTIKPANPASIEKDAARLKGLPDFIPRNGLDKSYGSTNPGWERYKGHSTEFKIFREGEFIKAIQVIDRSGKGVPDSFMKGVLRQVSKNPALTLGGSEIKDGYEILRGQLGDNTKIVYYRDEQGGIIRAFVLTWP